MCTSHRDVRKADGDGIRRWSVRRSAVRAIISMAALCVLIASPAKAIRRDECEQQRAAFPTEWNDVSKEKPLFFCWSHYSGAFKVTLGAGDKDGRRLMSLVPLTGSEKKAKPPSFDRRDHAGSAERCRVLTTVTATRSFSWTWQIRNPIGPTQARSTTRRRDSAYFTAIRMSAKRSSSIARLHLDFVRRAIEPGNIRRPTSRTARSRPSPTWAPRQPI
jgi:hypothetical protein